MMNDAMADLASHAAELRYSLYHILMVMLVSWTCGSGASYVVGLTPLSHMKNLSEHKK
jgi:hypothetical protein